MTAMTSVPTATTPKTNVWLASIYGGAATAIFAVLTLLVLQADLIWLAGLLFLLIGAGPVLGYQLATGRLFSDWKAIIGGIIGFILLFIGWPILVGALRKDQSIGKLFLGSLLGFVLGLVVFFLLGTIMGQNPSWVGFGFPMLWAVWGATATAAMTAWRKV